MKKIIIFIIFINLSFNHVFSTEPDVFVQSTVNSASQILSKNISKEEKINALRTIAKETVDIEGIGFLVASRPHNVHSIEVRGISDLIENKAEAAKQASESGNTSASLEIKLTSTCTSHK